MSNYLTGLKNSKPITLKTLLLYKMSKKMLLDTILVSLEKTSEKIEKAFGDAKSMKSKLKSGRITAVALSATPTFSGGLSTTTAVRQKTFSWMTKKTPISIAITGEQCLLARAKLKPYPLERIISKPRVPMPNRTKPCKTLPKMKMISKETDFQSNKPIGKVT